MLKRKNTECNAFEYLVARALSTEITFNHPDDKIAYLKDLEGRTKRMIESYENAFRNEMKKYEEFNQIKSVFLTGKYCHVPEICALNKQENPLEAKADVYALLNDGSWIGISVKQSSKATKSNYSVQSMFSHTQNLHLTNVKKQFLQSNGFTTFNKSERSQVNKLFYQDNPYWRELKTNIQEYNHCIKTFLYNKLYASSLRYPLFEFDSKQLKRVSSEHADITFEEHEPYYYSKKGVRRNAAKLFYRLLINEKEYRVEIRWKGNIFTASPQFQIHEMN